MITIENLIAKLNQYPKNAKCYAYEGEDIGITIVFEDKTTNKIKFEFIRCTPKEEED